MAFLAKNIITIIITNIYKKNTFVPENIIKYFWRNISLIFTETSWDAVYSPPHLTQEETEATAC